MVIQSEQLLETLLDLERARQREHEIRIETEALLEGLRGITGTQEQEALFQALVEALRPVINFDNAFILQSESESRMTVLTSTLAVLRDTVWEPGSVFRRALAGRPIASFDIAQVPEWKQQPEDTKQGITSALHIGLHGGGWEAILIITHAEARHFGPSHVKKAKRFSPLAAQALLTLELQQAVIQRDRFFQLSLDVMAIFEFSGTIKQFNNGWNSLLGYARQDVQDKDINCYVHPDDIETFRAIIHYLDKKGGKEFVELRLKKSNGNFLWFSCSLAAYHDERLIYVVARDITDRVIFEQQLAHSAGHDSLTGLKNRAEFMECLHRTFRQAAQQQDHFFALLFLDLNKFKTINDTLGHDVGDELLIHFANTLKDSVRDLDTVARLGGDEFTILLDSLPSVEDVEKVAMRIQEKCAVTVTLKGHPIEVSTSIGIALSSNRYADEDAMLQAADQAMYRAKGEASAAYIIAD